MPALDVADDVLQHDDRVVDDEADGQRQRQQRLLLMEKPQRYMPAKVPMTEIGSAMAGMTVARGCAGTGR